MPSAAEARLAQRIAHRWLYWQAWATRAWRKTGVEVKDLELEHCFRVEHCLKRDLPWTTITKNNLDSPLIPAEKFQFNLAAAVERRRQAKEKRRAHSSRSNL